MTLSTLPLASDEFAALNFSDLYIRNAAPHGEALGPDNGGLTALYLPVERERDIDTLLPVPASLTPDIERLFSLLRPSAKGKEEFSIQYRPIRFRVTLSHDVLYGDHYHLRRIPAEVPSMTALKIPDKIQQLLIGLGRTRGLVIVGGGSSQGKTTSAVAMLKAWLDKYGGFAKAVEDVEEYPLSGLYGGGKGHCVEVMVDDDDGWGPALVKALRERPRYIFVSEIRTTKAAIQVLRMAQAGQLVLCTFHGDTIEQVLEGFSQVAAREMGVDQANQVLANGLCAVIHQTLGKALDISFLTAGPGAGDPTRVAIRDGRFPSVKTIIERQHAKLMNPTPIGA